MDARRSFYLNSRQNDFAELSAEMRRSDRIDIDILYVTPANDNVPARGWLSARCRTLFLRLIAMRYADSIAIG
jgi:hypothetical protein